MLKQTVEYTDFDDNKSTETLYFNLTKSELTDNIHLKDDLESIQHMMDGDKRSLEGSEITQIIGLVKTFMRLSYGVRSADGKRFVKTDEQWTEFTQTAVYDAFLFGLFEQPQRAIDFMSGILPLDLRASAQAAAEKKMREMGVAASKSIAEQGESVGPKVADTSSIKADISPTTVATTQALASSDEEAQFRAWKEANAKNSAQQ